MASDPVIHVIDDDDAARDALQFLLSAANFSVRTYESAKGFLDAIPAAEAGCVITDVRMPEITGLELLHRLKTRGIGWPVIVITGQADVPVAIEAIKGGAVDFIEKPYDAETLLDAVSLAVDGQADEARDARRVELQQKLAALSPDERQVLTALVGGRSNSSIANDLDCSVRTVEVHRANVMTKMQARSLSHLVRMTLLAHPDRPTS
jgi:two-component system, LuxR family, response regulator FixJ